MRTLLLFIGLISFTAISSAEASDFEIAVIQKLEKPFLPKTEAQRFVRVKEKDGASHLCESTIEIKTQVTYAYILSQNLINDIEYIQSHNDTQIDEDDHIGTLIVKHLFSKQTPQQKSAIKNLKLKYLEQLNTARGFLRGDQSQAHLFANHLIQNIELQEQKDFLCHSSDSVEKSLALVDSSNSDS